jgi:HEAT repeat protein
MAVQAAPAAQQPVYSPPPPTPVTTAHLQPVSSQQSEITRNLDQLANASDQVRKESALQLGRLRTLEAVDPLAATLAGDRSPQVREAAARALALIGSSKALPALEQAVRADADSTVRHSAEFSIDVIRTR